MAIRRRWAASRNAREATAGRLAVFEGADVPGFSGSASRTLILILPILYPVSELQRRERDSNPQGLSPGGFQDRCHTIRRSLQAVSRPRRIIRSAVDLAI